LEVSDIDKAKGRRRLSTEGDINLFRAADDEFARIEGSVFPPKINLRGFTVINTYLENNYEFIVT
jgi:hypothetical protein